MYSGTEEWLQGMNWEGCGNKQSLCNVRTVPGLADSSYWISGLRHFKIWKNKIKSVKSFETRSEFFLAVMKAHGNEDGGRILLGDNTGGGADMVRPIRFRCAVVWISAGLRCVHMYVVDLT